MLGLGFEAVSKIVRRQKMVEVMEAERVIFTLRRYGLCLKWQSAYMKLIVN